MGILGEGFPRARVFRVKRFPGEFYQNVLNVERALKI